MFSVTSGAGFAKPSKSSGNCGHNFYQASFTVEILTSFHASHIVLMPFLRL
jgi:hypothetical protein